MMEQTLEWLLSDVNIRLLSAAFLGAILGLERELAGKDPSLRTFALISVGSCLFAMASDQSTPGGQIGDPFRISAQIVTGIGFLGAGVIFRSKQGVHGLTTAALMWMTAAIGMCIGLGRSDMAYSATIVALLITVCLRGVHHIINHVLGLNNKPKIDDSNRIE